MARKNKKKLSIILWPLRVIFLFLALTGEFILTPFKFFLTFIIIGLKDLAISAHSFWQNSHYGKKRPSRQLIQQNVQKKRKPITDTLSDFIKHQVLSLVINLRQSIQQSTKHVRSLLTL